MAALLLEPTRTVPLVNTPRKAFSNPFEKISVGGKLVTVYGAGANLIGTGARLVSSVKWSKPSKKFVTTEERMKLSRAAPGHPTGLMTMDARLVAGPLVLEKERALVKSIMLVSHCGPVTT